MKMLDGEMIDMIMCLHIGAKRSAMSDLYKNVMNCMPNKENTILVIPYSYEIGEFSNKFHAIIKENISKKNSFLVKAILYLFLIFRITLAIKKYKITKIFVENECTKLCIALKFFSPNIEFTLCLHDPILHEGESDANKRQREISNKYFFSNVSKFIVTYLGAFDIIKNSDMLSKMIKKFYYIKLPQMLEMEFKDIKENSNIPIVYNFIFYGRIEEYKGLDLLLESFNNNELKGMKLLIVGRGRDEKKIKKLCSSMKNVTFINDYVPNRQLAEYIKQSKCVVLPYMSATGSQTVQIANYYGRLVLATPVGCFKEYIIEGRNGFFIKERTVSEITKSLIKISKVDINSYQSSIKEEYNKFDINVIAKQIHDLIMK